MVIVLAIFGGVFICFSFNLLYFGGVFNKTIIPLALVGYEMIISIISYPTRARGIIVNYYTTVPHKDWELPNSRI